MNYTRIQIELLRKSLATLASAQAVSGDRGAEHRSSVAPETSAVATVAAKPERPVIRQDAATYFGGLNWSADPSSERAESPTPSPQSGSRQHRGQRGTAAEHFSSLPWTGEPAVSPTQAVHACAQTTIEATSAALTNASLPGNASAFFANLAWTRPSLEQQDGAATTNRACNDDISPGDFAQLATQTALASAQSKAAS